MGKSRRHDGEPENLADKRYFAARESGYKGWIDHNGLIVPCSRCGNPGCTAGLNERCNG